MGISRARCAATAIMPLAGAGEQAQEGRGFGGPAATGLQADDDEEAPTAPVELGVGVPAFAGSVADRSAGACVSARVRLTNGASTASWAPYHLNATGIPDRMVRLPQAGDPNKHPTPHRERISTVSPLTSTHLGGYPLPNGSHSNPVRACHALAAKNKMECNRS